MSVRYTLVNNMTDSTEHVCESAQLEFHNDESFYDEHQHVIPATCTECGKDVEYVYNDAGIRDADTREYIRLF